MSYNIILVPPSGILKKQDFSLHRIARWLKRNDHISIILLHIEIDNLQYDKTLFERIINVKTKEDIFEQIEYLEYDLIFHRSWMGSYDFAAELVKKYKDKVVVNIKDWNFSSKDVYRLLYLNNDDFESIEYIFINCKRILSHYTEEQYEIWAMEYSVDKNKFIFFPELCNIQSFINQKRYYNKKDIYLVYAGKISSTVMPEDYFPGKAHLRSVKLITKKNINIDFVLPPEVYSEFYVDSKKNMDFLYEEKMNNRFNIVCGEVLNPEVLGKYNFGFFELETTGLNHMLYKYAVTSKFAFYLEAGIPILVNDKFFSMAKLVAENGLGIVFSNDELDKLDIKLDISNLEYQKYIENIHMFRKNFTYDDFTLNLMGVE